MPVDEKINSFYKLNNRALEQPVMKGFLTVFENKKLLLEVINNPSEENNQLLEEKFKNFYKKTVIIKYINSLIRIYSIDFDKRVRRNKKRYLLLLDKPVQNDFEDSFTSMIDVIQTSSDDETYHLVAEKDLDFKSIIEDVNLYKALNQLTKKQYRVLELIYLKKLNNKQVANLFGESPQNISNIHNKALKRLRNLLVRDIKKGE